MAKIKFIDSLKTKQQSDTAKKEKTITIKVTEKEYERFSKIAENYSMSKQQLAYDALLDSGIIDISISLE